MNIKAINDQMNQSIDRQAKARFELIQARNRCDEAAIAKAEREQRKAQKQQLGIVKKMRQEEEKRGRENQEALMKAQGISRKFMRDVEGITKAFN